MSHNMRTEDVTVEVRYVRRLVVSIFYCVL